MSAEQTPIAVVGMACLLPGAHSPEQFWADLLAGADRRVDGGREVFGTDPTVPGGWGDPAHRITATRGGFVTEPAMDLDGYPVPAGELAGLDRVVRWPLWVAARALADAGISPEPGEALARTGLVLGNYSFPTESSVRLCVPLTRQAVTDGLRRGGLPVPPAGEGLDVDPRNLWPSGLPATVVADALRLGGPRLALDAACSSALYGFALARDYLATGAADVMLAGAVCAPDPLLIHLSFSDLNAYPDNGVSQPFDRSSTGIVTGQGAGILVLKRLADAQRDGDRIHAVIDAIGLTNDGTGKHVLVPNVTGQLGAYAAAYAEIDPATVDYVECHATGTPIGDSTELRGLAQFFDDRVGGAVPLLGSVKGNVGHLLTVAGFTSTLKAIMAMRDGVIPATPGVAEPVAPSGAEAAVGRLVRAARPWPADASGRPRRAGVSAFGFGGTNAHLVLSSAPESVASPTEVSHLSGSTALEAPLSHSSAEKATPPRLAITGIGAKLGALAGVPELDDAVRTATPALRPRPDRRWYGLDASGPSGEAGQPAGGYLDEVDVDVRTYRLPPAELGHANPQHLALFDATEQALADAGYPAPPLGTKAESVPARRVAVVIAMEAEPRTHTHRARFDIGAHVRAECARAGVQLDPGQLDELERTVRTAVHQDIGANEVLSYIGNVMASRVCASRNLTGPSFTLSADATAGARALEVAGLLLLDPSIEAVLVGGVDLAAGVENTVARARLARATAGDLPPLGDGAAAVVVTRPGSVPDGQRVYATVDAISLRTGAAGDQAAAATDALTTAGTEPSTVDYLELCGAAAPAELAAAYPAGDGDEPYSCVLGGLTEIAGDTQCASVLAAVVKVASCLHRAELPASPQGIDPTGTSALFSTIGEPQPWLRREHGRPRVAAIGAADPRGTGSAHLVLRGADTSGQRTAVAWSGVLMLPLHGDRGADLATQAAGYAEALRDGADPIGLCRRAVHDGGSGRYRAVLVATDADGLATQLEAAQRSLPPVIDAGADWVTPAGSYATGRPLGPDGRIAFVYPGAFTSYPGGGRDLFRLFPGLLDRFEEQASRPRERFKHGALFPRASRPVDRRALMRHEAEMVEDIPVMLATGTNSAVLHTQLLRDVLGVAPHGGFGYSLGESSMLFAMGVWAESARDDAALTATPLFRDRLRGPKTLLRELWQLGDQVPDGAVWSTHVLLASADQVRPLMAGLDRVYLTHVNTPGEVVVAGEPAQCRTLIERVGCQSAKAPANHVMHVPLAEAERSGLAALNSYPLGQPAPGLELFSAHDYDGYDPVTLADRELIAGRIAGTLCGPIDFARLASTAYDRGYRYFIEVGPGATCTRWISETLAGREHVAVSVDRRGVSVGVTLAQVLARLVSHGLPVDLGALFCPPPGEPAPRKLTIPVEVGGDPIPAIPIPIPAVPGVSAAEARAPGGSEQPLTSSAAEPSEVSRVNDDSEPDVLTAELVDEVITVDGEPFVYLPDVIPAATPAVPVGAAAAPASVLVSQPVPRNGTGAPQHPIRAIAASVAKAHRATLAAHDAIQQAIVRALESGGGSTGVDRLGDLAARGTPPSTQGISDSGGHAAPERAPGVVWDERELLEFAAGQVANVFGPEFAVVDTYPARVRLPEPPYLFVSRVTALDGTTGRFEPSSITTEYDIPADAWYGVDGLTPCAVTIEAGQCDLLLISYLGIDFRNQGERVYRLLDSTLVFHGDLPRAGQTLRYEINIDRFVWNADSLLFFFNYRCFADGELILELLDACAGFFNAAELDNSLGVVLTGADHRRRAALEKTWFKPLARTDRTALSNADLDLLSQGRVVDVFGQQYEQGDGVNPSIRLPDGPAGPGGSNSPDGGRPSLRMIDEITAIDRRGGPCALGELTAVKHLDPDGWYFRCHFTGDPVLAGSMVAEGGVQLLQTYAMYLGMHLVFPDAEFQSVPGLKTSVKVRGQITPATANLRYHAEITGLTMLPRPTVTADIVVYDGDKPIISMRDFGIQVREKPGTPYRPEQGGVPAYLGRRNKVGEPAFINELHLAHAAKGDLATAMGPEFGIYADRRAPYIPNGDFQFVDRIMRLDGTRMRLKPGATMATEYDSPPEAWYYADNGQPSMPNCVYMETSLQAAILLGYYLGATLASPDEELSIRNLDGTATVTRHVDLRGKTIRHESELLSSQAVPGATLQNFRYRLTADGEPFYEGESLFGYFSADALANQVGLDSGTYVPPWLDTRPEVSARTLKVRSEDRWFDRSRSLRLGDGHLRMVDEVDIVDGGGDHGQGYLRGRRTIDPADWYFNCHFHRDPVMPGSLGVEAILQALQVYVIDNGLASGIDNPVFALPVDVPTGWRYRGQILRTDREMTFDAHIKEVRREADRLLLIADASLWKPQLRIYQLTDIAVEVRAGQEGKS